MTEELSLIELAKFVSSSNDATPVLNILEAVLQKTKLKSSSPAAIVAFVSLHDILPAIKGTFPVLQDFLVTFQTAEPATKALKHAKVRTEVQDPTPAATTTATADVGARKLREGIFKSNLDGKKMCISHKIYLTIVFLLLDNETFSLLPLFLMSTMYLTSEI